ncbi:MAG: histidine kinase [Rikenellaceae bacterium]|nr:histidine kinase [Rikenellaceae bacterium]MCL2692225.1 histidine kinase [Rikenellaceae bacterium]
MVLKILLIISIVLQLAATIIAIGMTRRTKFNFSWIAFSIALMLMSALRLGEYVEITRAFDMRVGPYFFVWLGVITSLCFAMGMFYVLKIFNYQDQRDHQRTLSGRRILNTVLRTEERERMRFSKELHDGLGPLLSSARMSLSALKKDGLSAANREIMDNTAHVIEEAIRSLREISNNLSPHILNDFGLAKGIANFIGKIPPGGMEIDFQTNLRDERFDTDIEVILYRVVCELVNNSLKHSGGRRINIALTYADNALALAYADDGRGFNRDAMMDVGMGLSNIASRIGSLKGECDISSTPGSGMKAAITVATATPR